METSESSEALNSCVGYCALDGDLDYITKYNSIINELTVEDIKKAANEYLNLEKPL
ncbi:MAG: hypothetical protein L6V95_08725 [Candidatus Melainabacteria bacterium]|nr:MAG: hypothetical protein L6V95_08725 [Candidatus Melainabacteria bacterium]